ncbi:MAG: dTDP-4-dehydrorhamnose reductase [Flavobacteriaceae bacterium CG17_big_fil_post_rev_8_21_14_2_50_33_15]|nr:MAG: dTDP-4-dehydrorhamnose reductase [Flavobacteriaceae bacterium CG17_big_fil_post_rev_8_21_14_2_50_33_15]
MKKILVTGSLGQLGRCLQDKANQHADFEFKFVDKDELDICHAEQVARFFKEYKPDFCINTAAYTAVDKAEEDTQKAFDVNAKGPKNLAESCLEHNTVLIHISTDFVFDGQKATPYTETDHPNPISVYGDTKLKGEIEIQKTLKKYFIIRTSWLYSEHGYNFMKTMLRLAKERDEISVVDDQIGTPTYAGDLAGVILEIIAFDKDNYGIYHYSNEGTVSWFDFAKAIFEVSKLSTKVLPIKTKSYPTPAKRPKYSALDKTKIKDFLKKDIVFWRDSLNKVLTKI